MADAKDLIDALRDDFFRRCENDRELKRIAEKLEKGTYVDAHEYSVRIGELLSQSFTEVLTEDIYPELTEEMARQIIPSLLGSGHRRTSDACVQVQRSLNQVAGLGLRPIEPEFDVGRAYDLAEKYVSYDEWKDARWALGEPVENFMQSVPDDAIRRNADFQWRSGMSPKIIRRAEPGACKWCMALAGTYDYADVRETGNDVYRRHERCRCVVEYDPGDGKRQDVHSKEFLLPSPQHGDNVGSFLRQVQVLGRTIENSISKRKINSIIRTISENHEGLSVHTPAEWKKIFEDAGFEAIPLNRGSFKGIEFSSGGGYRVIWDSDGSYFQYHPEGGRYHYGAYYKISSGKTGTIRYNLDGSIKDD